MTGPAATSVFAKSRELVLHYIVEDRARRHPGKPCLVMDDKTLTYEQVDREANCWARGLAKHGVRKGDRVLVMIPSGIDHVVIWLGLCKLGALMVPVNAAYRGRMLEHQANDSAATLAIVDARHLPTWNAVALQLIDLATIAVYPYRDPACEGTHHQSQHISAYGLRDPDASPMPPAVDYFDPMAIFYTSGTTAYALR